MTPLPILDSHVPPVRVMALHALAYCPRLFYLEEVEEIRVADARVFAGRELHAGLAADEEGEALSLELASEVLGLVGKVDCIRGAMAPTFPTSTSAASPHETPTARPRPGRRIACKSSPMQCCSKRRMDRPFPKAACAIMPPMSPCACPSMSRRGRNCSKH